MSQESNVRKNELKMVQFHLEPGDHPNYKLTILEFLKLGLTELNDFSEKVSCDKVVPVNKI